MEFSTYWHSFFTSPLLFPYHFLPDNYVHWIQTPDSHVYSAEIPETEPCCSEHFAAQLQCSVEIRPHGQQAHEMCGEVYLILGSTEHISVIHLARVKKEEIRVEVENSRYLIIRTEISEESSSEPVRSFLSKFRLPDTNTIDLNGISAGYEDGVLTVTVPRLFVSRGIFVRPDDLSEQVGFLARAA